MSKHTPKSWKIVEGFSPVVKEIKGPSFTIAAIMWATDFTEKDCQNRHDDLHLIAAAPDLLEALEALVTQVSDSHAYGELADARAAIAKAKGEV